MFTIEDVNQNHHTIVGVYLRGIRQDKSYEHVYTEDTYTKEVAFHIRSAECVGLIRKDRMIIMPNHIVSVQALER